MQLKDLKLKITGMNDHMYLIGKFAAVSNSQYYVK